VKHVGDAVVVFDDKFVAPLFKVTLPKTAEFVGSAGVVGAAPPARETPLDVWERPQWIGTRRLVVPDEGNSIVKYGSGRERSGTMVWLPPMPKLDVTAHERRTKRRFNRREWQVQRRYCRRLRDVALGKAAREPQ
jgi:hypothetical protein